MFEIAPDCQITFPLCAIALMSNVTTIEATRPLPLIAMTEVIMSPHMRGLVLLAEVDPMIGLDFADALEATGYEVSELLHTVAEAIEWLGSWNPTAAVINVILADGCSARLAQILRERGVPFLVQADTDEHEPLAEAFAGAPRISQPAWHPDVIEQINQFSQRPAISC